MTAPVDIALNLAIGASVVLASRAAIVEERLLRAAALWALLGFQALLFVPIAAYLMWRYPEWSAMYLMEAEAVAARGWLIVASYPAAALVGLLITRALLRQARPVVAYVFAIGCLALTAAVAGFGHRQILGVGTTAAFRADPSSLPGLGSSPLVWVLVPALLVLVAGWGVMIWRLFLYGRAWHPAPLAPMAGVGGDGEGKGARPAGTMKLQAQGRAAPEEQA